MLTLRQTLRRKWKVMLLMGAVLGSLLSSLSAFAAERERAVLFLSEEDLQLVLSRPSSLSLSTYRRLAPSSEQQEQSKVAAQEGSGALSLRWDTHPASDSSIRLGTRPLWGY